LAALQRGHRTANGVRKTQVVSHYDDRSPIQRLRADNTCEAIDGRCIEAARGLIEKEKPRAMDESPRKGDTLPLAARKRAHRADCKRPQLESFSHDCGRARRIRAPMKACGEFDVLDARQVWITKRIVSHPSERPPNLRSRSS
jgi:hypothetical protein